jgi:hypothetical protein
LSIGHRSQHRLNRCADVHNRDGEQLKVRIGARFHDFPDEESMPASPVTLAIEPVSDTAAGVPRSESRTGLKSLTLLMLVVVDAELFAAEGETGRTSCALPVRCRAPRLMPTLQILLARTCHFAPRRPHVDGDEGDFAGSSSAAGPPQSHTAP